MTSKDRFPNHETICGQCGTTIYKPFKELSDDEIDSIWTEMSEQCDEEFIDMKQFARAILKKASEK
jgi:hypothetical protein